MKIEIDVNAAVRIWDLLNEVALNHPKGAFRRSVIKHRNVVEKAMTDKGLSIPESGNGRARRFTLVQWNGKVVAAKSCGNTVPVLNSNYLGSHFGKVA